MTDYTLKQENNIILETEAAYELNLTENSYEKLLDYLHSDSLNLIYYALLKIERFKTKEDALVLLNFLNPDQDSRLREQASSLVKDHMKDKEYYHYFNDEDSVMILAETIRDKNPKVCRNITYALQNINNTFMIIEKLVNIIEEQIKIINKEQTNNITVFTIYWCLFAVENLINLDNITDNIIKTLVKTLQKTSLFKEYQIRERSAAIVRLLTPNINHEKLSELKEQLSNDENFYVRTAIS